MKPPKFYVGQAVACTIQKWEIIAEGEYKHTGMRPVKGQVYHIGEESEEYYGVWFYAIVECPGTGLFQESCFTPLEELPAEALAQLLEETLPEPVTA